MPWAKRRVFVVFMFGQRAMDDVENFFVYIDMRNSHATHKTTDRHTDTPLRTPLLSGVLSGAPLIATHPRLRSPCYLMLMPARLLFFPACFFSPACFRLSVPPLPT